MDKQVVAHPYNGLVKWLSWVQLFTTPWTVAYQAPPPMGFSRQEYWSGLPFPSPGDLPNPGIESRSPTLQADSLPADPQGKPFIKKFNITLPYSRTVPFLGIYPGEMKAFVHSKTCT